MVLIVEVQILTVYPAVIAFPIDVAPGVIIEAAADIQECIGRNGGDQRIIRARSGSQIHSALSVGAAGPGGGVIAECSESREQHKKTLHNITQQLLLRASLSLSAGGRNRVVRRFF